MSDDLADRVARFFWWHSIDLGQGIITPGKKSPALHEQESVAFFDRVDLTGCSVLDIGAWNGFYSFEAKRRGAGRVLATDSYCWTDDRFKGRETFDLAREALGADIEAQEIDVSDIKPETTGPFDVVMFLGVFYHRYDPIEALARAASVTKELLIIESHIDLQALDRPAMVFYPGNELLNDASNWWGPNLLCLEALLRGHGFCEIEIAFHPQTQSRAVIHAWRSTRLRRTPLAAPAQLVLENDAAMIQKIVDPTEYVQRFCEEIGEPILVRDEVALETQDNKKRSKRRLFLRMYQYKGRPFVIRAYERILGRPPEPEEIQSAQRAFFEREQSRTFMMLMLRFGEEGRLAASCNVVGLSALRVFWNITHRRNRRIAPLSKER